MDNNYLSPVAKTVTVVVQRPVSSSTEKLNDLSDFSGVWDDEE